MSPQEVTEVSQLTIQFQRLEKVSAELSGFTSRLTTQVQMLMPMPVPEVEPAPKSTNEVPNPGGFVGRLEAEINKMDEALTSFHMIVEHLSKVIG